MFSSTATEVALFFSRCLCQQPRLGQGQKKKKEVKMWNKGEMDVSREERGEIMKRKGETRESKTHTASESVFHIYPIS